MASRAHSVADLEAGADVKAESELHPDEEYQRIKENYRTTVIVPELPGWFFNDMIMINVMTI